MHLDQPFSHDPGATMACQACEGDFELRQETATSHRVAYCRWCVRGAMTSETFRRWQEHGAKPSV